MIRKKLTTIMRTRKVLEGGCVPKRDLMRVGYYHGHPILIDLSDAHATPIERERIVCGAEQVQRRGMLLCDLLEVLRNELRNK